MSTTLSPLKSVQNIYAYEPLKLIGHNKLVGAHLLVWNLHTNYAYLYF
jgi:hypothetical protein